MTFGDIFNILVMLIIVSIPAIIIALVHEKKRKTRYPSTKPYTWGLFTGWSLTIAGSFNFLFWVTYPLWADPEEYTPEEILGQVLYSCFVFLLPGIFILSRKRWAWIWEIVTSLVLAPLRIPIDIVYLKNRWQEMRRKTMAEVATPPQPATGIAKKSMIWPLLCGATVAVFFLFGGSYVLLKYIIGNAPIHKAAAKGDLVRIQALIQQNPSLLNLENNVGLTAIHLAALKGKTPVVEYLIDSGTYVDKLGRDGWTPLLKACEGGKVETARLLLDRGAYVNFRTAKYSNSPLHRAANYGYLELVKMLVSNGADINIRNNSNNTPLHRAVNGNYPEVVEFLISKGAEVNIRNDYGRTPLNIAIEGDYRKCSRILREHGGHE